MLYLQNNEGIIKYSPSFSFTQNGSQTTVVTRATRFENAGTLSNSYNVTKPIQFQDGSLTLIVFATFQPIDEASQVLVRFLPYISIIVLIIGVGSAYFYSRFITKPLIYINEGAQKMANLDFSEKIEVRSTDELGELSNSLNDMSINLQQAMFDLKKANQQLKNDIEKEREIETKRREFLRL